MSNVNEDEIPTFNLITKCLSQVPPFNGDQRDLSSFIERIESFIPLIEGLTGEHYKKLILGHIQDKIIGKAKQFLLSHGPIVTWAVLKSILIKNHGDTVPVSRLVDNLILVRCNSTIKNFYDEINSKLTRINNAYSLQGGDNKEKIEANKRIALNTFKDNLPEPVRGIIVNRNPTTLFDAYEIIAQNDYLYFKGIQSKNNYSVNDNRNKHKISNNFQKKYDNPNNNQQQKNSKTLNSPTNNYHNNSFNRQNSQQFRYNNSNQHRYNYDNSRSNNRPFNSQNSARFNRTNNYRNAQPQSGRYSQNNRGLSPDISMNGTNQPMDIAMNLNGETNTNSTNFRDNASNNYPI